MSDLELADDLCVPDLELVDDLCVTDLEVVYDLCARLVLDLGLEKTDEEVVGGQSVRGEEEALHRLVRLPETSRTT